ncbi:hypothetical protein LTS18_002260, partial [Coniosporium uncinatum]
MDDDRIFELVLRNGLVVRLQAFDKMTRKEWIKRLRHLVKYWHARKRADVDLIKSVRQQNLKTLRIDEEAEAIVGQFARKWEVTKSYASPELYNMCGISCCRTIHMSGTLYRKPRRHATFARCSVLLAPSKMLIFKDTMRTRSGKIIPHIHHEKVDTIDLASCYLYSGLLTEPDLLYQNRTFDSNYPGHTALPRIYPEDGWTGVDEDVMCTFVLWTNTSKAWLRRGGKDDLDIHGEDSVRAQFDRKVNEQVEGWSKWFDEGDRKEEKEGRSGRAHLKRVSQLGVKGRSIVFKAR